MHRPAAAVAVSLVGGLALLLSPLDAAPKRDYAAASGAWSILPPGENGSLAFDRNTTDQARLYDGLTPLRGNVTPRDLRRFFKPSPSGSARQAAEAGKAALGRDHRPRPVRGRSRDRQERDRRGLRRRLGHRSRPRPAAPAHPRPARVAALDVPGLDPLTLALSGRTFVPSAEAEAFLANQLDALRSQGPTGQKVLAIANAYAAGINAWYRAKGIPATPFAPNDAVASAALIAARFGASGGQEAENAMFLDALEECVGASEARRVFADLHDSNDPEAPVTVPGSFPYELPSQRFPGSVVLDDGSFVSAPFEQTAFASNAVLVGAKRSETGHPLFVAGPQVGTSSRSSSRRWSSPAPASPPAAPCSRGSRSSSSAAAPTSRGTQLPRRRTTSTSSSRPSVRTTATTSIAASARRCAGFSWGR